MGLFIYIIYLNEVLKRLRKALFTIPVEEGSSSKASGEAECNFRGIDQSLR